MSHDSRYTLPEARHMERQGYEMREVTFLGDSQPMYVIVGRRMPQPEPLTGQSYVTEWVPMRGTALDVWA